MPSKPEKWVLAFVLKNLSGRYLLVRRGQDSDEYPDSWSLPTITISKRDWKKAVGDGGDPAEHFRSKFGELPDGVHTRLVSATLRQRPKYSLHMALFEIMHDDVPQGLFAKYEAAEFVEASQVPSRFPDGGGTCIAMLIQKLISEERLPLTTRFVEMPPHLIGQSVEQLDGLRLWREGGAHSYFSYLKQGGVRGGADLKRLTIDRFVEERVLANVNWARSAIDLGCGDGTLARRLRNLGLNAIGVDIGVEPAPHEQSFLHPADINEAPTLVGEAQDLIILHLVLQWLDDLGTLANVLDRLSKVGSKVIATLVPTEFRTGDWRVRDGEWIWEISEPLRRKPIITMINHSVGPLKLHERTIPEYFEFFGRAGFVCEHARYVYFDSFLGDEEAKNILREEPGFIRHSKTPCFLGMEFVKAVPGGRSIK